MTLKAHKRVGWRDASGFTVIELLLASAVTMIIALVMISLISNILTAWGRLSGNLATGSEARVILDVIAEDLQSAFYEEDGNIWLAVSVLHGTANDGTGNSGVWSNDAANHPKPTNDESLDLLPEDPGESFDARRERWRYGTAGTWLRFFSRGPASDPEFKQGDSIDDPARSDQLPRATAYQIVRRPVTSATDAEIRYMLFRSTVTAANTLRYGYDITANEYMNGNGTLGHPGNIRQPELSTVIANDVIDFGVRLYTRDPSTGDLELVFPDPTSSTTREYSAGVDDEPFPDVIDVFIRILTPEGVQLIRNHEAQPAGMTPSQSWWEIAEANSQVYVRRVQLNAAR